MPLELLSWSDGQREKTLAQARAAEGLRIAEELCRARGVQFTASRRSVLEALWKIGKPVGAYGVIAYLEAELGRQVTPPTVYRAMEFLMEQGLVARIESRNAFTPCARPDHDHACVFLICDTCGSSQEVENRAAEDLFACDAECCGFRIGKHVVELHGSCAACNAAAGV